MRGEKERKGKKRIGRARSGRRTARFCRPGVSRNGSVRTLQTTEPPPSPGRPLFRKGGWSARAFVKCERAFLGGSCTM